ncbi:hypothetical protein OROGR_020869 [Orobanche gracilis]
MASLLSLNLDQLHYGKTQLQPPSPLSTGADRLPSDRPLVSSSTPAPTIKQPFIHSGRSISDLI